MQNFRNRQGKRKWERTDPDVGVCQRGCLGNTDHYHCPCVTCKYKIVAKMTEYRHWVKYNVPSDSAYSDESDLSEAESNINDNQNLSNGESEIQIEADVSRLVFFIIL